MNNSELEDCIQEFLTHHVSKIAELLIKYDKNILNEDGVMFEADLTNGKVIKIIYEDVSPTDEPEVSQ